MHTPVLMKEVVELLCTGPDKKIIDATYGEGGHTRALLAAGATVLAIDRDITQISNDKLQSSNGELILKQGNFADIVSLAKEAHFSPVDGILFDLGLSYEQLKTGGKGLSYKNVNEVLDMRLDDGCEMTAEQILRQYTEKNLAHMFMHNAEETLAVPLAKKIIMQRTGHEQLTVGWLVGVIGGIAKSNPRPTLTRVFQALRVEVNNEFANLERALAGSVSLLSPGGRIAVISFHSLEDRIVKRFIRSNGYTQLGKKPVFGNDELRFERSAVLRVFHI